MTEAKRPRRRVTAEFKKQLVQLYASGKPRAEIIREYELTPSAFDNGFVNTKQVVHSPRKTIARLNKKS